MPSLPPFFSGNISGVLTLSISDLVWYKNNLKSNCVLFEWTGSQEKDKLSTSKYSKLTYDIRTSYKTFLYYLSTCTLKCSFKSCGNKIVAQAFITNLLSVSREKQTVKIIPLINNTEIVGSMKICFNLLTFNDTSFDEDINYIKKYGIQNEVLNILSDSEFNYSEKPNNQKYELPIKSLSSRTNRSKENLTNNYLLGKDMEPEEEEEALNALKTMPSVESIISAAEKISIHSPPLSPLHIQGNVKMKTVIKPSVKNVEPIQKSLKKSCADLNKCVLKKTSFKKLHQALASKDDMYLHLSIHSIHIYHTIKSLQHCINSTYIVQCLKDQQPYKLLRFMSRHVDDNVVKFKSSTQSSRLDGCSIKGITIKAFVRHLSKCTPIILGETKQMLDWTGLSTTFDIPQYIKVPIWNNNKITGHLSLSYEFSKIFKDKKCEDRFPEKPIENISETEDNEKQQCQHTNITKSVHTSIKKRNEEDCNGTISCQIKEQIFLNNRLYPDKSDDTVGNKLLVNEESVSKWPSEESTRTTKEKEIQTNFEGRSFNKSVQTLIKSCNVASQVYSDELEEPKDKTINYDVQNIFRCTHEFTCNIEKNCTSTFDYVTYQFPESMTSNTGKVTTCCQTFRTYGNTNMLHLVTLPTTTSLESYFDNYYKRVAIVLNLHQNNEGSTRKVSLLVSHLLEMANEFNTSHITKDLILYNNSSVSDLPHDNIRIIIHYKRVNHSFPSPEKQPKNSSSPHKSFENNSKLIVDLTESDSEDTSINKTYTLFKHNDRLAGVTVENGTQTDLIPVRLSHHRRTQTEKYMSQQHSIIDNESCATKIGTQTDSIVAVDNQTNTEISHKNITFNEFDDNEIFQAKVTIVCGYDLPMVKLKGDTASTAPTTYVIMKNYDGNSLITCSVVQQTNPTWNSEWTIIMPKNKLITKKLLELELWCKKYKNEYAGHDPNRDVRLGYVFVDTSTFKNDDMNGVDGLYDVISEIGTHHGRIKVMINPINFFNSQTDDNFESQPTNKKNIIYTKEKNKNQKCKDDSINKTSRKTHIENSYQIKTRKPVAVRNEKCVEFVDLTRDSPEKLNKSPPKNTLPETCLKNNIVDNSDIYDTTTSSSVTSWTTSSLDDIICSKNPIVNDIQSNETKMKRIRQIFQK